MLTRLIVVEEKRHGILLTSGTIAMAIFIIMNGLPKKTLATQWVAVACVIIFQFLTGFGWMGCPWLVSRE